MRKKTSHHISRENKKTSLKSNGRLTKKEMINPFKLGEEETEEISEAISLEDEDVQSATSTNESEPQDRSEDLINETDPFIQDPDKRLRTLKDNRL